MIRLRWAGLLVGLALLLSACGWQGTGVIVEKTHRNGYSYVTLIGKVPVTQWMPESWGYEVRSDENGDVHGVRTTHQDWLSHDVGDRFDNREDGD